MTNSTKTKSITGKKKKAKATSPKPTSTKTRKRKRFFISRESSAPYYFLKTLLSTQSPSTATDPIARPSTNSLSRAGTSGNR